MDGTSPEVARQDTRNWIRAGLLGLPLYGLLTLWASRDPQPNPDVDYAAWARFVTTDEYVLTHVLGSGLGLVFGVFGTFALGVCLARTPVARVGLWAMVVANAGQAGLLIVAGVSAFAAPQEGQAYLAGMRLDELPASTARTTQTIVLLTAILLCFVGNVLLGIAVWRSASLPRGAGALWALAAVLMYPFGIVLGALTTGATPLTVTVGAGIVVVAGGWMTSQVTFRESQKEDPRAKSLSAS